MARDLKFRIQVEEGLYYPYSENKGADQLRGHREADLRLCFRKCQKPVFSQRGSYMLDIHIDGKRGTGRPKMSWKTFTERIFVSGISIRLTLLVRMCGDQV